jgi:hypothetical protein
MKMSLTLITLIFSLRLLAPENRTLVIIRDEPIQPYEAIWNAVVKIESSGNRFAYHLEDNGTESLGLAQIQDCRVLEYNRLTGQNLKHIDMYDPAIAKKLFLFYAHRYGPYRKDDFIRSWNGSGSQTIKYLAKVKQLLIK